jgi:hypothetical protein
VGLTKNADMYAEKLIEKSNNKETLVNSLFICSVILNFIRAATLIPYFKKISWTVNDVLTLFTNIPL